jgi:immune inhibitor A
VHPSMHAGEASRPCFVAPSPELKEKLDAELAKIKGRSKSALVDSLALAKEPRALGFNDGMIVPADEYPFGTSDLVMRSGSADRAPLRGSVRVIVVLVDFSDKHMAATQQHFRDLFFSTGVIPTGSVKEYYQEVTGGLVDITGDVVGPYRMPHTNAWYANGNFGIGKPSGTTRARDLAQDAFAAADPHVNFGPYDNDGNGFVDAFIVVHGGSGGEQTGNSNDIWSHKWTLASAQTTDNTKVFGYLTIPEDARIGVCAHELGHLLFGFPDLYDTDDSSEGIGNWCLMAGGSWNGNGDTPAHPSAWCKVNQGWATVTNVNQNGNITVNDVKSSKQVFRMWKDGASGQEYFLLENRQKTGYDSHLPGDGLLLWHIDDSKPTNTDENHYKVGLVQADGLRNMELRVNRGDAGDPFPGSKGITAVSGSTTPTTKSYTGTDTCVSLTGVPASAASMSVGVTVRCVTKNHKELKEFAKEIENKRFIKDSIKDFKEIENKRLIKDHKELKEFAKDGTKDIKEFKEVKELKEFKEGKEFDRPGDPRDFGRPGFGGGGAAADQSGGDQLTAALGILDQAVSYLHAVVDSSGGAGATPYIDESLRPDLYGGPSYGGASSDTEKRMAEGDPMAKREFDAPAS